MNVSIEEKKTEAISRMKALGIFPQTIKQFEKADYISISEPPFGAFYWASGDDLERIRDFEKENNALVYVVVRCFTTIGDMDSYLFVSDYKDEWAADRAHLKTGEVCCYTYNHDMPDCSECGYIGIAPTSAAGLRRTW